MQQTKHNGFTLVELMIVIAIVGILAAVAIPQYSDYTRRTKFAEVISLTSQYKTAVSICAQESNGTRTCSPGTGPSNNPGIPPNLLVPSGYVQSITTNAGVITAVGIPEVGGLNYVLTPTWTPNVGITWQAGGSCLAANYCEE